MRRISGPEAPAPAPESRWRERLRALPSWTRNALLVAFGAAFAVALFALYRLAFPLAPSLTGGELASLVERALAEQEPLPSTASRAYSVIRPSVVLIQGLPPDVAEGEGLSLGSGVVFDGETGDILTCLHVVQGCAAIRVVFADGSDSGALVLAEMPDNDLAVLRPFVIPDDLRPATLAGSAGLQPGDEVFVVGSPFGIPDSISAGVVSGLGRSFEARDSGQLLEGLIQFDAAANPGNSGGPLVDRNGEVVGIVSAILSPTEEEFFVGIGFAVTLESAGGALGPPLL